MNLIKWLESEELDWQTGVVLARQFLHTPLPFAMQRRVHQDWVEKSIRLELKALLLPFAEKAKNEPVKNAVTFTTGPTLPDEVMKIKQAAKILHKHQADAHTRMKVAVEQGDIETTEKTAAEILEYQIRLDNHYDQIRSWEHTGIVPVVADANVVKMVMEKFKKMNVLTVQLSQIKSKIKTANPTDLKRLEDKKEVIENELQTLKTEWGL